MVLIGCGTNKEISKAKVKPHAPLYEIIGVDSSYTADRTNFMGTKYHLELTNDEVKVSRKLNPSSGPGVTRKGTYNPFEEKLTREYVMPDETKTKLWGVFQRGRTSDIIYNNKVWVDADYIWDMMDIKPDSNLAKIRKQYKFDK